MILAVGVAGGGRAAATDNEKTWYVNASTSNDSNTGHTPTTAKATLTSAASASVEGDTFYIAPGTYTAANPKGGQTWIGSGWTTILEKNQVSPAAVALGSLSGVTIDNLKIQNPNSGGTAISSAGCTACVLRRVWVDAPNYAGNLGGFNEGLIDQCRATSNSYAWLINGRATTVQNTIGVSNATVDVGSSNSLGCFRTGLGSSTDRDVQVTFQRCQAYSSRTASNNVITAGWESDGYGVVLLQNCTALIRSTAESEAGSLVGANAKGNGVLMASGNCVFRAESGGDEV